MLTEEDMVEYRPHFRSYKVYLPDNTFVFHKFDQDATVKTLLDILISNQNISPKAAKVRLAFFSSPFLFSVN
jgi:hypothetical protein